MFPLDKLHFKCDCFHGPKTDGFGEYTLCIFALEKPPGFNFFANWKQNTIAKEQTGNENSKIFSGG